MSKSVIVVSAYNLKSLYPSLGNLVEYLSEKMEVFVLSPGENPWPNRKNVIYYRTPHLKIKKIQHIIHVTVALIFSLYILTKHRNRRISVITLGPIAALVGLLKFVQRRIRFYLYLPELYIPKSSLFRRLLRFLIKHAYVTIDVSSERVNLRNELLSLNGTNPTMLLPNYPSGDFCQLSSIYENEIPRSGPIRFVYGGALTPEHDLSSIIGALEHLRHTDNLSFELDIYGIVHADNAYVKSLISQMIDGDKHIRFLSSIPRNEYLTTLSRYDIGICTYPWIDGAKADMNSKYAAPSKIYDYIKSGLITLCGKHPTLSFIVEKKYGAMFCYGSNTELVLATRATIKYCKIINRRKMALEARKEYQLMPHLSDLCASILN